MKITRRNFVQALGTAMAITVSGAGVRSALGLTTIDGAGFNAPAEGSLFKMSADELNQFIGRQFVATSEDGQQVDLILLEVNDVSRPANSKRGYSGECFSVVFKYEGEEDLAQGIYEIKSVEIGSVSALLVPTGRRRRELEMVINRLAL